MVKDSNNRDLNLDPSVRSLILWLHSAEVSQLGVRIVPDEKDIEAMISIAIINLLQYSVWQKGKPFTEEQNREQIFL